MKKIFSLFFGVCMFFVFVFSASAEENTEVILGVYKMDPITNELFEVPLDEYLSEVENPETVSNEVLPPRITSPTKDNLIQPMAYQPYYFYKFVPYGTIIAYNTAQAVSAPLQCPTSNKSGCPITIQYATTITRSYSISIQSGVEDIVSTAIGYDYTTAKTNTSSSAYNISVPAGKRGYIAFKPRVNKITGYLQYWYKLPASESLKSTEILTVTQPRKNGNYSDGYFLLLEYLTNNEID